MDHSLEPRHVHLALSTTDADVTLAFYDDLTALDFLAKCELLALAVGFSPETWHDAILTKADELEPRNPTL